MRPPTGEEGLKVVRVGFYAGLSGHVVVFRAKSGGLPCRDYGPRQARAPGRAGGPKNRACGRAVVLRAIWTSIGASTTSFFGSVDDE